MNMAYFKIDSAACNQIKMKSYSIRVGPTPTRLVSLEETQPHKGNSHVRLETEVRVMYLQAKHGQCHQKPGGYKAQSLPGAFRGVMALLTP